jgi:hypothetical protein
MPNFEHIQADNGEIIQVNSIELTTKSGQEWLQQELDSKREETKKALDLDELLDTLRR